MTKLPRRALGVALFLLCGAPSSCQSFSNVVVPATDTDSPTLWNGVYDVSAGQYVDLAPSPSSAQFAVALADQGNTYLAVGAAIDPGGVAEVNLAGEVDLWCWGPDGKDYLWSSREVPTEFQKGSVGSTVSDGLWTYGVVRFDQYLTRCPSVVPGGHFEFVQYLWTTEGLDFAGHISSDERAGRTSGWIYLNYTCPTATGPCHE